MLLHDILKEEGWHLILASQAPLRRELMANCGLQHSTTARDREECYPSDMSAMEVAPYLSLEKSKMYGRDLEPKELLITADTLVLLGGKVLGKPSDKAGAKAMLRELSGMTHHVVTGVTLRTCDRLTTFSVTTAVCFCALSDEQIEHYVECYEPLDKAGSYGIQEWIGYIGVERIDGSFYNVMGLPIQRLHMELERFISL